RKIAWPDSSTGRIRLRFALSRECTTSMSKVLTGAPLRTAATPPTTINSTPPSQRARKKGSILGAAIQLPGPVNKVLMILQHLQPLSGRHRKHRPDQRQIYAVLGVLGRWRILKVSFHYIHFHCTGTLNATVLTTPARWNWTQIR